MMQLHTGHDTQHAFFVPVVSPPQRTRRTPPQRLFADLAPSAHLQQHVPSAHTTHAAHPARPHLFNRAGLNHTSVSKALDALVRALSGGSGNGNGSGGAGSGNSGNGSGFVDRLIDVFFGAECAPCKRLCTQKMTHRIDMPTVVRATEVLIRAMDATLRRTKKHSLSTHLYDYITRRLNAKLARRGLPVPVAAHIFRLAPGFLRYDVTRGVRLKVLDYLLANYVTYYVPQVSYATANVNALLTSTRLRPYLETFLRGRESDLAPLAGALMRYALEANGLTSFQTATPACILCKKLPLQCNR